METNTNEHLYLVCVHYPLRAQEEWEWYAHQLVVNYDDVITRLANDLCYLRRVLRPRLDKNGQFWKGFAFIFLDPGWTSLLGGSSPIGMAALGGDLTTVQIEIEKRLSQNPTLCSSPDPKRERIVTAGNLLYLLDLLHTAARGRGESFYKLLAGGAQTLRYDAPKVIEAAIRIANIGKGIPLFRFDDDVIFCGQRSPGVSNPNSVADATAENLMRLCERY